MKNLARTVVTLLLLCVGARGLAAQACPCTGACPWVYPTIPLDFMTVETKSYTWAPSTAVVVYNSGVPSNSVAAAIQGWDLAYEDMLNTTPKKICYLPLFYSTGPGTGQRINMSYGPIGNVAGCTSPCIVRGITYLNQATFLNGRIDSVSVVINSLVTAPTAITEIIAHEIGHTEGEGDCFYPACPIGSSVMESGVQTTSPNNLIGLPGPSCLDESVVISVAVDYECPCDGQIPCGGGGGGGDAATPPPTTPISMLDQHKCAVPGLKAREGAMPSPASK
jgi:hypothetical protein